MFSQIVCLFLACLPPLLGGGQSPPAVLCGQVSNLPAREEGFFLNAFVLHLERVAPDKLKVQLDEQGNFCLEFAVREFQEVRVSLLDRYLPVLVGPGDSLYFSIDAKALVEKPDFSAAIQVSGDRADLNREALAYWTECHPVEYLLAPDLLLPAAVYRDSLSRRRRESLDRLENFREKREMSDVLYDWAQQEVELSSVKYLFLYAIRQKDKDAIYKLVDTDHFFSWDTLHRFEPRFVLSWAYHQFLSGNINYLNFAQPVRMFPDFRSYSPEQRKEISRLYGDSLFMAQVEWIIDIPGGQFRDHLLTKMCGNALEFSQMAFTIQQSYIDEIADERLRRRVQNKYDLSRRQDLELKNPEAHVAVPDTVRDIVAWAGRQFPGQVVVLDFWAVWCGSCIKAVEQDLPGFLPLFAGEPMVWIMVGVGSERNFLIDRANRFTVDVRHMFPNQEQDRFVAQEYGVRALPRYLVLGRDGRMLEDLAPGPGPELEGLVRAALK